MDQQLEQQYRDSLWQTLCQGLQSQADAMGMNRTPEIRQLMHSVVQKVCAQPSPQSQEELNRRMNHRMVASAIIGSLSHGDSMVQSRPTAFQAMLIESTRLSEYDILGIDDATAVFAQMMIHGATIFALFISHPARFP